MASIAADRLRTLSGWVFLASLLVFVAGVVWTVTEAPCSRLGAYLLLAGLGLGVLAACALLARAFLEHPIRSILAALLVIAICAVEYFVSYTFTLMLCRGM